MSHFSLPTARGRFAIRFAARSCLLLAFVSCGWMAAGGSQVRAQEGAEPCVDTLATAEKQYRNRNYEKAITLASKCTDHQDVGEETAIRAYRLMTLASLRRNALTDARSAVTSILQIDPSYTADPVNDPPSYRTFVSMTRDRVETRPPGQEGAGASEREPSRTWLARIEGSFFVKPLGLGFSDYTGDMPANSYGHPLDFQEFGQGSGFPFILHSELGYQSSQRRAFVLGVLIGNYPVIGYNTGDNSISDSWRYSLQFLYRYAYGPLGESVVFYSDKGINLTFGGKGTAKTGYGLTLGGGVDIPVSPSLSFYVESRFNLVFPDDAIDGTDTGRSLTGPFDMVNELLGVGLRVRF